MSFLQERENRRRFLKQTSFLVAGLTLIACGRKRTEFDSQPETKIDVPEFVIPNNGDVVEIKNLQEIITRDVGIQRLLIFCNNQPDLTFIFMENAPYSDAIPLGFRQSDPNLTFIDGFIPYNGRFNVDEAIATLSKQQEEEEKAEPLDFKGTIAWAESKILPFNSALGALGYHLTPKLNTDLMLVIGANATYLFNDEEIKLSPPAIVKAKFRFIAKKAQTV